MPVGTARPIRVDVRVLAATNRDLEEMVAEGGFRADLFARLYGYTVQLPPLRARRQDIGVLIAALLPRCAPGRAQRTAFTVDAARALLEYDWPLNVRELEKALTTAIVLAGDAPIDVTHLPAAVRALRLPGAPTLSEEDARRREELITLLQQHRGNVSAVARALGCARMQIHRWARRYGVQLERFRG
jgi:transcriptional regulator with GAF, ATPase, and Fis domain